MIPIKPSVNSSTHEVYTAKSYCQKMRNILNKHFIMQNCRSVYSSLTTRNRGSEASLLVIIIYQGNSDNNKKIRNVK